VKAKTVMREIDADVVLPMLGFVSDIGPLADWGLTLEKDEIVVNSMMETGRPGIYAAGDVTTYPGKLKLIATGFAEAAAAVNQAVHHVYPEKKVAPGHSSNMSIFGQTDDWGAEFGAGASASGAGVIAGENGWLQNPSCFGGPHLPWSIPCRNCPNRHGRSREDALPGVQCHAANRRLRYAAEPHQFLLQSRQNIASDWAEADRYCHHGVELQNRRRYDSGSTDSIPQNVPPAMVRAASNDKIDVDFQKQVNTELENYIKAISHAIVGAHDDWRYKAFLKGVKIMGPVAIGGSISGPLLSVNLIMYGPQQGAWGNAGAYTRAIADGLASCWRDWEQSVRVPSLVWYPAFATMHFPVVHPHRTFRRRLTR
jgi:hypothetical protein